MIEAWLLLYLLLRASGNACDSFKLCCISRCDPMNDWSRDLTKNMIDLATWSRLIWPNPWSETWWKIELDYWVNADSFIAVGRNTNIRSRRWKVKKLGMKALEGRKTSDDFIRRDTSTNDGIWTEYGFWCSRNYEGRGGSTQRIHTLVLWA